MTFDLDNPDDCAKILEWYLTLSKADLADAEETVRATLFIIETAKAMKANKSIDNA